MINPVGNGGSRGAQRAQALALLAVAAILLLAAAVRFAGTASRPVWTDEGFTAWATSEADLRVTFERVEEWDRHPPLYHFTLVGWRVVAGDSRLVLRFWSIMSGLIACSLVYRLGADWLSRRAAWIAVLLFAVLDLAVYYAQEVRPYGWLVMAAALMSLLFLRYLRHPRRGLLIAYTLSIVFMLYSLYLGLLVVAVQGVVGLFIWRGPRGAKLGLVAAWVAAAILFVPWLAVLAGQFDRGYNSVNEGIGGFPGSLATTWPNLRRVAELAFGGQWALSGGAAALGIAALFRARRGATWTARAYLALAGAGLLAFMVVANLWFGVLSARTLAFLTPCLMLMAAWGLDTLGARAGPVLAGAFALVTLVTPQTVQPRLQSDDAARAVAADWSPGDLVILETGWDDNAFWYELTQALPPGANIIRTLPWVGNPLTAEPVIPHVADAIAAHRRVWVVRWLQPSAVMPYLEAEGGGFRQVIVREVPTGAEYAVEYPTEPLVTAALYERPDLDAAPVAFGDLFALHDAVLPGALPPGGRLHVDLWWAALEPPPLDYSVGVFLLDAGGAAVAEHQGPPGDRPTTAWEAGELVFDRHTLALPPDLPPGTYAVAVTVYWYGDLEPLPANGETLVTVGTVRVE